MKKADEAVKRAQKILGREGWGVNDVYNRGNDSNDISGRASGGGRGVGVVETPHLQAPPKNQQRLQSLQHLQQQHQQQRRLSGGNNRGASPRSSPRASPSPPQRSGHQLSYIHQKYAQRRLSALSPGTDISLIPEEENEDLENSFDTAESDGEDGHPEGTRYHIVKPGDTFQFILLKYKISADQLREANGIVGKSLNGFAGKRLVIPPSSSSPTKSDGAREGSSSRDSSRGGSLSSNKDEERKPSPQQRLEHRKSDLTLKTSLLRASHTSSSTSNSSAPSFGEIEEFKPTPVMSNKSPVAVPTQFSGSRINAAHGGRLPLEATRQQQDEVQYHWVEPDDSLRWICLKYKVSLFCCL